MKVKGRYLEWKATNESRDRKMGEKIKQGLGDVNQPTLKLVFTGNTF